MRRKAGQTIVLMALTSTLMMGGIGIAVDLVVGYMYSIAAERAAAAAALSGVVFMPSQFSSGQSIPTGSRNDASDRAIDEAQRNGFDVANTQEGVAVVPSPVAGHPNQLQVSVGKLAPVFFMQLFGFRPYLVKRTAVATYLPPISLGQPGSQIGSSLGELGRTRFFFLREEGWAVDRGEGDAYTPNPLGGSSGPSDDVHQLSFANLTTPIDTTLSDRGGYDYRITIPSNGLGGVVQVYDAAFAPDGTGSSANFCDNNNQNPAARTCSVRGNSWFHEDDQGVFSFDNPANYSTMRYSLYRVNNIFIRSSDELLSQLTVFPIDARNWNASSRQYTIMGGVNRSRTVDQQYAGGLPTNMLIYHNWIDVTSYNGANDRGLVNLRTTAALANYLDEGALAAGTYRLRVDMLDNNGLSFAGSATTGHKAYAVRAVNGDATRTTCTTCQVASWNEMCFFTPFDAGSGGSFQMSLFELSRDYAGLTVSVDLWDVGDISSTDGRLVINILDPNGNNSFPGGVNIYDLGSQRSNLASGNYAVWASAASGNTRASFVALDTSTGQSAGNRWVHLEIQVPASYNAVPGSDWWSMQYVTGPGTVAIDTVTVAVGLKGGPVHLVP